MPEMLTDLIAARVLELFEAHAVAGDWCVTFTANGDEDVWVQVTADVVNVSYPRSTEPAATFGKLGRNPRVLAWEAGKFATLQIDEAGDAAAIAAFVDWIFVALHGLTPDAYGIETEMVNLDAEGDG